MPHYEIDHSETPIRLFQSNFLEFFSHIHPAVVIIIWLPVIIFFLVKALLADVPGVSRWYIPLAFGSGLFFWTFAEYTVHRFVFHFKPKGPLQERISFMFHGIHHAQPQCKTRLVMPPVVSIPMGLIFYGLFYLVLGLLFQAPYLIPPAFAATLTGYLLYDLTHYATHHFRMRKGYFRFLKRYHMAHHYKSWDKRFGVTSPLWDMVFGTYVPN